VGGDVTTGMPRQRLAGFQWNPADGFDFTGTTCRVQGAFDEQIGKSAFAGYNEVDISLSKKKWCIVYRRFIAACVMWEDFSCEWRQ
jgi:hypothetical protein